MIDGTIYLVSREDGGITEIRDSEYCGLDDAAIAALDERVIPHLILRTALAAAAAIVRRKAGAS